MILQIGFTEGPYARIDDEITDQRMDSGQIAYNLTLLREQAIRAWQEALAFEHTLATNEANTADD